MVVGTILVVAMAALLHVLGAETAEVVGTLLFVVVFAVTLYGGRIAGLLAAVVATGLYVWLRQDTLDDVGAARLGVVALGRAASYLVLAYVTDVTRHRLPQLPVLTLARPGRSDAARSAAAAAALERGYQPEVKVEPPMPVDDAWLPPTAPTTPVGEGWEAEQWEPAATVAAEEWEAAGQEWEAAGDEWEPAGWESGQDQLQEEPVGNGASTDGSLYVPSHLDELAPPLAQNEWLPAGGPVEADGWDMSGMPGEPQMPTGWMEEAEYGEEIPVGYTGELFLQDLTGPLESPPTEYQPTEYQPTEYQPTEYQPTEYQPTEYQVAEYQVAEPQATDYPPTDYQLAEPPPVDDDYAIGRHGSVTGEVPVIEPVSIRRPPPRPVRPSFGSSPLAGPQPLAPGYEPYAGAEGYQDHRPPAPSYQAVPQQDPETRLWTAGYFRDRLAAERDQTRLTGGSFSVVMIQVPNTPFHTLSHRREVALLRELGHQFIRAKVVDHLVHLPDQGQHWFAVVLADTGKAGAHGFERRLRSAIAGYLRNRGLGLGDIQSATLTSPDDDEMMSTIWSSLLGEEQVDEHAWAADSSW